MKVRRARIMNQAIVAVPAEQAWSYLIDWAGTNRQRAGKLGELTLAKIELVGGMAELPRTRVMEFGAHGVVRETLLYQDDETMHLYYNIEGIGPNGMRNYLATTDVDPLGNDSCQITITARFDLDSGADMAKAKALVDLAHNQSVIGAIERYYAIESQTL